MKSTTFRLFLRLAAVMAALCLAPASTLQAQVECSQEQFAGAWVQYNHLDALEIGPFPATGPLSIISAFTIDDQGLVTGGKQTGSTPTGVFPVSDPTAATDIQFTVGADCAGGITWTNRESGARIQEAFLVCANGQRECWAVFVAPQGLVGVSTLKRVDDFDAQLEAKVDVVAAQLASLSRKVDAIMRRLGLIPSAFE